MSSTDAGSKPEPDRPLRDRPLVRVLILAAVLGLALFAAQTCASRDSEVDQDEAVEIAREAIDFEPERTMVRFLPQGLQSRPTWAVSFSTLGPDGQPERTTVVVVDATSGEISEIRRQAR